MRVRQTDAGVGERCLLSRRDPLDDSTRHLLLPPVVAVSRARITMPSQILHILQWVLLVEVTARRTKQDFVHCMQQLVDGYYPAAEVIRVVVDNLNIHTPAALYDFLPPHEAHRLLQRLEFHYTPKHGSWLNMVEIELSVLAEQCLKRRLPDKATVAQEVAAWEPQRNEARPPCSGVSPRKRLAPNSIASTPHNPCGEVIGFY